MTDAPDATTTLAARATGFPRWLRVGLIALWGLVSWFVLTDIPRNLAVPDIVDMSWRGVLTYAAEQHWQWGKQIVFTYGPLGFVHHPVFTAESWWKSLLYQVLHAAVYLVVLWRVGAGLRRREWRWLLYIAAVIFPAIEPDAVQMLLVWFTGLLLVRDTESERRTGRSALQGDTEPERRMGWSALQGDTESERRTGKSALQGDTESERRTGKSALQGDRVAVWLGLAAVIVAAHIKITFLLHAGVMLGVCGGELALARRWRAAGLPVAVFVVGFLLLWVTICGQALGNLPGYLHYSLNMAEGFSEAMGLPAPLPKLLLGLLLGAGVGVLQLLPLRERGPSQPGRHWGTALLGLATLYLAWKQSMVRWDIYHAQTLVGVMLPMLVVGLANLRAFPGEPSKTKGWLIGTAGGLLGFALLWQFPFARLWVDGADALSWIRFTITRPASIGPAFTVGAARYQLPEVKRVVGRSTIDFIGFRESTVILNGLNYHPAPVFQSYAAFTPELIDLNTRFYQSAEAPEFVLYMVTRLDQRLPSADNALIVLELLKNYTPLFKEGNFILFKRTPRGEVVKSLLAEGELVNGSPLNLPETTEALWCELDIRETLLGKLFKQVLYRPALPLDILAKKASKRNTFGVVPGSAGQGFLISPTVNSKLTMTSTYDPAVAPPPLIIGFYLKGGLEHLIQPKVGYRIYKLNLALDPVKDAETLAAVRRLRSEWEAEQNQQPGP